MTGDMPLSAGAVQARSMTPFPGVAARSWGAPGEEGCNNNAHVSFRAPLETAPEKRTVRSDWLSYVIPIDQRAVGCGSELRIIQELLARLYVHVSSLMRSDVKPPKRTERSAIG